MKIATQRESARMNLIKNYSYIQFQFFNDIYWIWNCPHICMSALFSTVYYCAPCDL
ncbi:unnamed protein product [Amoebophrya sp. A120]|nr:unnamed protein product [Amoebophrya sp. A120]|eukprot:GSA120T00005036001.1